MNLPPPPRRHGLGSFEIAAVLHLGIYLGHATWYFGGNSPGAKVALTLWGALSVPILAGGLLSTRARSTMHLSRLKWLVPVVAFNALVLVSALTPGLNEFHLSGATYYGARPVPAWLPSAAVPGEALAGLALFDGMFLSAFNLALFVRHRRVLRGLLLFACANTLVLAVFGTLQKLSGATGIFFGLQKVHQPYFFASFVYHNHWGAYTLLMTGACLALIWYYGRRKSGRDFFHTPAFAGLVALFFIAATVPLSTSRSCSAQMLLLLFAAYAHLATRLLQGRSRHKGGLQRPAMLLAATAAALVALGGIWFLAKDTIILRLEKTREQLSDMQAQGGIGSRAILYRDTCRMAKDRLWFGWGMNSYPVVFHFYNTQTPGPIDHLPVSYHDAHSDWLQSLAEHGIVGSLALAFCVLVPLASVAAHPPLSSFPNYLFGVCALILLYAWIEFPFGNSCVILTWWTCFFAAIRYTQLQRGEKVSPDEESA